MLIKEKIMLLGKDIKIVNNTNGLLDITASYRLYNKSLSSNKFHMAICQWKNYRKARKIKFISKHILFFKLCFKWLFKV